VGPRRWLISSRADFWFASGGASAGLLAALVLIVFWGDRELDWLDLVLSELHLGATYDAVLRRRLWRRMPGDVIAIPVLILAATFALASAGHWLVITSIAVYAAIWHRGRQSFGIARYDQKSGNGVISPTHRRLFAGAIYAPMVAAAFLYSHLAQVDYDGEPYFALNAGATVAWSLSVIAAGSLVTYLIWTRRGSALEPKQELHPGEIWIVLSHAVAFGSAYLLGATRASFLFVLTVHHEVQYLYFTYAMARRQKQAEGSQTMEQQRQRLWQKRPFSEMRLATSFAVWPVIGLAGTLGSSLYSTEWLASLGIGGLFCHYWLDGRIWTRRSMTNT